MSEWISVKDRLPENEVDAILAILLNGNYYVMIGRRSGYVWDIYTLDGIQWVNSVTHWMPLPEPPKEAPHEN
jgi:hypothetical protein